MLYRTLDDGIVVCDLCRFSCHIKDGRRGQCGVRENRKGRLYSLVYGHLVAENSDPIEKKPLFHVLPHSHSYSISTVGCNFHCKHCQNASISQPGYLDTNDVPGIIRSPDLVVEQALSNGCKSISYTYVEPTIFFEFAYDCSVLSREKGLKNIFVSNGYMSGKTTETLAQVLDAINIDVKSFSDDFYKKVCGARLQPVLDSVVKMKECGVWVEVTTLLIPGLNDSPEELAGIADFLVGVDPAIPWHVTAFYPSYKMTDRPPTSVESLQRARDIGLTAGLRHVYQGNVPGGGGETTWCPACGRELISRYGFSVQKNRLKDGCCDACGEKIPGVWG